MARLVLVVRFFPDVVCCVMFLGIRRAEFRSLVRQLPGLAIWLGLLAQTIQWRYRSGFSPDSPSISRPGEGLPGGCRFVFRGAKGLGSHGDA